jgi:3-methylcrotonyl-CoA carboxylase alpha subunit
MRGHAIEARICAENPDAQFLPATGTLQVARWPAHVAFTRSPGQGELPRVDSGFGEGDEVSPHYDSMIAKLIVWGASRTQALARLDAALRDTHLMGLHTNVAFLRRLLATRAFASADLDTALIERERAALFDAAPLPAEVAAAGAAAALLAAEGALEDADPWSRRDGWRLFGTAERALHLQRDGQPLQAALLRQHAGGLQLRVGAQAWPYSARALGADRFDIQLGPARHRLAVHARGEQVAVFAEQGSALLTVLDPLAHAGDGAAEGGRLAAPMPGKVVAFLVAAGAQVQRGQALAVMEAMKMEHTLHAPRDGSVAELLFAVGDPVKEGDELLRLATPG